MQAQVGANVCRLRNVAWETGGHEEGNPLSTDVVSQPLSRFKGRLGRNEKKKDTQTHTLKVGLYTVCVSPWRYCLGGAYAPQGMNDCKAETEKREKGRLLALSQNWQTYTFKQELQRHRFMNELQTIDLFMFMKDREGWILKPRSECGMQLRHSFRSTVL